MTETTAIIIVAFVLVGLGIWLRRRQVLAYLERSTRPDADEADSFYGGWNPFREYGRTEVEGVFHDEDAEITGAEWSGGDRGPEVVGLPPGVTASKSIWGERKFRISVDVSAYTLEQAIDTFEAHVAALKKAGYQPVVRGGGGGDAAIYSIIVARAEQLKPGIVLAPDTTNVVKVETWGGGGPKKIQ